MIDSTDATGRTRAGLYPLLEPLFGRGSQDDDKKEQRFQQFTNGTSALGNTFRDTLDELIEKCPHAQRGPLSIEPTNIRPNKDGGKQEITTKM